MTPQNDATVELPAWKRLSLLAILALTSVAATLGALELAARYYAYEIALMGKLYQTDPELGYSRRPNITVKRRASDGSIYTVTTNGSGRRVSPDRPDEPLWREGAERRVLIVGDSFAEGHVDIENRMDRVMERSRPKWATEAIGVSGYGTGQQLALARKYYDTLQPDDVVLLLTCGNDFYDLVLRSSSGRAKSFVTLENGRIVEHPPELGLRPWLRDRSFLAGFLIVRMERWAQATDAELDQGHRLYAALVAREAGRLDAQGLRFLIAHHTDGVGGRKDFFRSFAVEVGVPMLALDEQIGIWESSNPLFLPDGHWNGPGNHAVARALVEFISSVSND